MELMNYIKYIKLFLDIFFYPSTLLHELSHYVACIVTNIKVTNVCWLDTNINNSYLAKVEYEYDEEKEPLIKQIMISFAPLIYLPLFVYELFNPFNHAYTVKFDFIVYLYVMACIGSSCLPSTEDIRLAIKSYTYKKIMKI